MGWLMSPTGPFQMASSRAGSERGVGALGLAAQVAVGLEPSCWATVAAAEANAVARSPAAEPAIWVRSWSASVWALAKSDGAGRDRVAAGIGAARCRPGPR